MIWKMMTQITRSNVRSHHITRFTIWLRTKVCACVMFLYKCDRNGLWSMNFFVLSIEWKFRRWKTYEVVQNVSPFQFHLFSFSSIRLEIVCWHSFALNEQSHRLRRNEWKELKFYRLMDNWVLETHVHRILQCADGNGNSSKWKNQAIANFHWIEWSSMPRNG